MKRYFIILSILIYGCSSTIPDEYVLELESLKKELKRTKSIARSAVNQVHDLERKLSKSIIESIEGIDAYWILSNQKGYDEIFSSNWPDS